ncbi:MAG: preprotein translocase subunit SecE [Lachnospiraceae bacterium]
MQNSANKWLKNLQSEFKKIIWPGKKQVAEETGVVVIISIVLGIIIAILDMIFQYGVQLLIR